uniref:Uncharacterized protein n=1 Tax=Setaria italica TaxID=4555 RepID=K3ZBA5_SETIT
MTNWHCVFHVPALNLHEMDTTAEGTKLKNGVNFDASFLAIICKFNNFNVSLSTLLQLYFFSNLCLRFVFFLKVQLRLVSVSWS